MEIGGKRATSEFWGQGSAGCSAGWSGAGWAWDSCKYSKYSKYSEHIVALDGRVCGESCGVSSKEREWLSRCEQRAKSASAGESATSESASVGERIKSESASAGETQQREPLPVRGVLCHRVSEPWQLLLCALHGHWNAFR